MNEPCQENSKDKQVMCEICKENETRYTCPRCSLKTCSLKCINIHKSETKCSGVRNRTNMVEKQHMDNLTLLNDYRFLEEIEHRIDDNLRDPLRYVIKRKTDEHKPDLPVHMLRLKTEAKRRGTFLEFLPQHFSRRKHNSTRFMFQQNVIRWHIKLVFPQAGVTYIEEKVDENERIGTIIKKYIVPKEEDLPEGHPDLKFYQSASFSGVSILLKNENSPYKNGNNDNKMAFSQLFPSKSLKLNLYGKYIIEYPIFYVVLNHHLSSYLEYEGIEDGEDLFKEENRGDLDHINPSINQKEEEYKEDERSKVRKLNVPKIKRDVMGGLSFFNSAYSSDESDHE